MNILMIFLTYIVSAFMIYNTYDWFMCEILKRLYYNTRDKAVISDSEKSLLISEIGVKAAVRMVKSMCFKSKYHVLVSEIQTTLEQIPYEEV